MVSFIYILEKDRKNNDNDKRKRSSLCNKYEKIYKSLTINERIQWVQKELHNEKNKNR